MNAIEIKNLSLPELKELRESKEEELIGWQVEMKSAEEKEKVFLKEKISCLHQCLSLIDSQILDGEMGLW